MEIELSAGIIEYEDTGGDGPVARAVVRADDGRSLWDGLIADLSADYRAWH
jgi:hypothetical protein